MEDAKNVKIKQPIKPNTVTDTLSIKDFMAHLTECLARGKDRGKSMGILHNAIKSVIFDDTSHTYIELKDGKKIRIDAIE